MMAQTGQQTRQNLSVLVPVLLLDEQMPHLRDTELRILLVVLRQTRVQARETTSSWLTHRELCRRTGRASEAVSAAIDALVQRGLLRVRDEEGAVLKSATQRQARTGRRFYQVVQVVNAPVPADGVVGKAKTIEVNKNIYSFRKTEGEYTLATGKLSSDEKQRIEQEKEGIRKRLSSLSHQGKRGLR